MKKVIALVVLVLFAAPCVFAAGTDVKGSAGQALLEKAKAEGKVTFYANITSVEPILEDFE